MINLKKRIYIEYYYLIYGLEISPIKQKNNGIRANISLGKNSFRQSYISFDCDRLNKLYNFITIRLTIHRSLWNKPRKETPMK